MALEVQGDLISNGETKLLNAHHCRIFIAVLQLVRCFSFIAVRVLVMTILRSFVMSIQFSYNDSARCDGQPHVLAHVPDISRVNLPSNVKIDARDQCGGHAQFGTIRHCAVTSKVPIVLFLGGCGFKNWYGNSRQNVLARVLLVRPATKLAVKFIEMLVLHRPHGTPPNIRGSQRLFSAVAQTVTEIFVLGVAAQR